MREADVEVFQMAVSMLIVPTSIHALLRWDEGRLSPRERERAWPPSTRLSAVLGSLLAWGPLCVPVHYCRTRRSLRGFLLGILFMLAIVALSVAGQILVALLLED